jgi:hypothetical protein
LMDEFDLKPEKMELKYGREYTELEGKGRG